jgi:uncharacterized protein YerC
MTVARIIPGGPETARHIMEITTTIAIATITTTATRAIPYGREAYRLVRGHRSTLHRDRGP